MDNEVYILSKQSISDTLYSRQYYFKTFPILGTVTQYVDTTIRGL